MATTPGRMRARPSADGLLLGRVANVPVLLSPSWWAGAALIVLFYTPLVGELLDGAGVWASAVIAAAFTVLLAVSVLLHELGHCLVALRLGLPVRRVRLFLLGGISEISRTPSRPRQEGLIAVAGPAVSMALAAVTAVGWWALNPGGAIWLLVAQTCVANLTVGVFNLLPGLPLDGGRMLRAATWSMTGRRDRGTTAGVVGAFAVASALIVWALVGMAGDTSQKWLRLGVSLLMAWFVVAGAVSERSGERAVHWPPGMRVRDLVHPILQLPAESPVEDALLAAAGRGVVLVRADGVAVGLLDQVTAERLAVHSPGEPAERAAEPVTAESVLNDDDSAELVLDRLRATRSRQFLVVDTEGRPSGVLRRQELREILDEDSPG